MSCGGARGKAPPLDQDFPDHETNRFRGGRNDVPRKPIWHILQPKSAL